MKYTDAELRAISKWAVVDSERERDLARELLAARRALKRERVSRYAEWHEAAPRSKALHQAAEALTRLDRALGKAQGRARP